MVRVVPFWFLFLDFFRKLSSPSPVLISFLLLEMTEPPPSTQPALFTFKPHLRSSPLALPSSLFLHLIAINFGCCCYHFLPLLLPLLLLLLVIVQPSPKDARAAYNNSSFFLPWLSHFLPSQACLLPVLERSHQPRFQQAWWPKFVALHLFNTFP